MGAWVWGWGQMLSQPRGVEGGAKVWHPCVGSCHLLAQFCGRVGHVQPGLPNPQVRAQS